MLASGTANFFFGKKDLLLSTKTTSEEVTQTASSHQSLRHRLPTERQAYNQDCPKRNYNKTKESI